jgi:hypothetical protein
MSEEKKEEGKAYRVYLIDTIGFSDTASSVTVKSAVAATGSLAVYDQYYNETVAAVEKAASSGSMSPNDIETTKKTLEKWHTLSKEYNYRIQEFSKQEKPKEVVEVKKQIDNGIPEQQKLLEDIHERIIGNKTWVKIVEIFNVKSSYKQDTAFFKDKSHDNLVHWLLTWIENNDKEKLMGDIIHGQREGGIDLTIFQNPSGVQPRFGIQVKNNNDVKEKDFAMSLKAQMMDSKKHQLQGLIVFLAADLNDESVEKKVNYILADISQMKDPSIIVISPERAATIIREVT